MSAPLANAPPLAEGRFFRELESVRGIAALLVVLYHLVSWGTGFHDVAAVRNGYLMVPLFFVLSGFVIYRAYAGRIVDFGGIARFQFLRFARLYPVHLLFFVLFFVFLNGSRMLAEATGKVSMGPVYENDWGDVIQQLLLVQALPGGQPLSFNNPAWSISVEFYTYLVFAIVVASFKSWHLWIFGVLAALGLIWQVAGWLPSFKHLMSCFAGFFLGCLTAFVSQRFAPRVPPLAAWLPLGAIVALVAFKGTSTAFDVTIYFLSALLILALASPLDGSLRALLRTRVLTYLGTISYSIYMSHAFVIALTEKVLRIAFHKTVFSPVGAVIVNGLIIAAVIAVSSFVYATVEKPIRAAARAPASPQGSRQKDGPSTMHSA